MASNSTLAAHFDSKKFKLERISMKNIAVLIVAVIALCASYFGFHAVIPACIAGVVFGVSFVIQVKANNRVEAEDQVQINETNEALRTGVIETHLLIVQKLFAYPDVAKQAIAKLVDAAHYLGGPPPSPMVIGAAYIIAWNKEGLARVAEAKAIVDALLEARPPLGGLGDIQQ
jgi:hypothetical protein